MINDFLGSILISNLVKIAVNTQSTSKEFERSRVQGKGSVERVLSSVDILLN